MIIGDLGKRLALLRHECGLTLGQAAAASDISPQYLSDIEHNRRALPPDVARRLALTLHTDVRVLNLWAGRLPLTWQAAVIGMDAATVWPLLKAIEGCIASAQLEAE